MEKRTWSLYVAAIAVALTVATASNTFAQTSLVAEGRLALDAGKVDDALAIFEKAVAANPNDPAALAWLGNAQVRKTSTVALFERPDWVRKGFETLDRAVARFPNEFVVYLVRGNTGARVPPMFGKAPVAIKDLHAVIDTHAKNPGAVPQSVMPSVYLNLGLAHKQNGDPAAARAAWEKGKALYPQAPEAAAMDNELKSLSP